MIKKNTFSQKKKKNILDKLREDLEVRGNDPGR